MEMDPHAVLEGLAICAYAVGATEGIVFIRSEYPTALQRMQQAIDEANAAGVLGASVLGSGFRLKVSVFPGMGSYVCGEETALLNALEGFRGEVRLRPPYPAVSGLYGRPTVVNNVETLVSVPWIARRGAEAYAVLGTAACSGTKAMCMNHGFAAPGIDEIEFGLPLRQLIEALASGGAGGASLEAVLLGGPMGSVLRPDEWDVPICYEAMSQRGIQLGHGGLVAVPEGTDFAALLRHWLHFLQQESCGRCVPCREGSRQALELAGPGARDAQRRQLERLLEVIGEGSLCAFGQQTPEPVKQIVHHFGDRIFGGADVTRAPAQATIDGRIVDLRDGETILSAARRLGIDIPTLCFSPDLPAQGGCRMCLVEIVPGGSLRGACHTLLQGGMDVRTESDRLDSLRRDILELNLAANPAGTFIPSPDGNQVERLMNRFGLSADGGRHREASRAIDTSHPYLRFDSSRCIACRRCLEACESIQGQFVYGIEGRGRARTSSSDPPSGSPTARAPRAARASITARRRPSPIATG